MTLEYIGLALIFSMPLIIITFLIVESVTEGIKRRKLMEEKLEVYRYEFKFEYLNDKKEVNRKGLKVIQGGK